MAEGVEAINPEGAQMTRSDLHIAVSTSRPIQVLWPFVLIAAAFIHNLSVSWLKWGDPIVDAGREWMMPLRMLQGESLYMEHRNLYGPLAPYLNMLLFRVFGVHLSVLQASGVISAALMTTAIFLLARRFLKRLPSTMMAVTFLYAFGFAHLTPNPSFNFVLPYSSAATYGMVAATLGLFFLIRHTQEGRDFDLAFSIIGLVLAALSKLETLLPIATAHGAYLAASLFMRRITRRQISFYAAGAAALVVLYGLIAANTGVHLWTNNLAVVVNVGNKAFAFETLGFDNLSQSLALLAVSAAVMAVVTGVGMAASLLLRRERPLLIRWVAVGIPAAFAFAVYATLGVDLPLRLLPALAITSVAAFIWRFWRGPELRPEILPSLLLWVFTAGCLVRLGLEAGPFFYGFFLVPVPFVTLCVLLLRDIPELTGRTPWSRLAVEATGIGVVAGITVAAFLTSTAFYAQHTMDVETPRGHIILRGESWQKEVISYLRTLPLDSRVAVIPQGAGLLFLSGVRMAGGLYSYAPMEMAGSHIDEEVVRMFRSDPPDFVVHLTQDPGSFRYTGFGIEYGRQTAMWLQMNYRPVAGSREVTILRYIGAKDAS